MPASQHSGSSGGAASFRILILGETGSGKTRLTSRIALALAHAAGGGKITVIDMAPDYNGVGAPMMAVPGARIMSARLYAPRLMSGGDCGRAWLLARRNAVETTRMLLEYLRDPTPILVVNDLSMHLHAGDPGLLVDAIESSTIFIGNSYSGDRLRDNCGIWEKELEAVNRIAEMVDLVWRL